LKNLGFKMAFEGGLSFKIGDIVAPEEKLTLVEEANQEVEEIVMSYNMGVITITKGIIRLLTFGHIQTPDSPKSSLTN
jgi:DNA-directed RNA polymerase beta' subunit